MYKWSVNVLTEKKNQKIEKKDGDVPPAAKLAIAGLSGMLTGLILQPIDLIKIRMQVNGEGGIKKSYTTTFEAAKNIIHKEGVLGFYKGVSANLLRNGIYSSARYGIYELLIELLKGQKKFSGLHVHGFIFAGFFGSFAITPLDVAVVRMMADGHLPVTERRNYKNVFNSLYRIGKEEGLIGLWAGYIPTIMKSLIASYTQIHSYLEFKSVLIKRGYIEDNISCHFICGIFSGLIGTIAISPFDICKTRLQTMKTENGIPTYTGLIDVLRKIVKEEGITALWKGFGPAVIRTTKATALLFIFSEQLNVLYRKYVIGMSDPKRLIKD